eukprot:CAMPEP_0115019934 /NCGR_PEP_ID=MMETSP0216-20121206/29778_1 /TAXON_ID=223996 /ORGANISM="Protocruzia adherens, Strain Boccale" /LENGTH=179 /DNA_ID=CAMNT_0002391577 /DNA_START=70 /DNA_END=609 /DNA_ORIENTATION=-
MASNRGKFKSHLIYELHWGDGEVEIGFDSASQNLPEWLRLYKDDVKRWAEDQSLKENSNAAKTKFIVKVLMFVMYFWMFLQLISFITLWTFLDYVSYTSLTIMIGSVILSLGLRLTHSIKRDSERATLEEPPESQKLKVVHSRTSIRIYTFIGPQPTAHHVPEEKEEDEDDSFTASHRL